MDNEKKEQYRGTEEFLDVKALGALRAESKYKEVYEICKEKYKQFPDSNFIASQYLIALIDYNILDSDEIKKVSDKLLEGKSKYYANFGYVMYYLSLDNVNEAYKSFQVIKNDSFLVRKVVTRINGYRKSKDFRNMILDVDRAIEEINQPDYPIKRYIFKTFDIAEHFYLEKDYKKALEYYELSNEKRVPERKSLCYLMIGKCYAHLYNFELFKYNFEKALEYSKKYNSEDDFHIYYKTLYQYIYTLIDFNEYQEAYELITDLEKGSKKDKLMAIFLRGKIFKHLGEFEEAIKIFQSILDKDKEEKRFVLIELVKTYILMDDEENATKYIDILYSEYEDEGPSHKMLYYYDLMKNEECIEYSKQYLESDYDVIAKFYTARSLCRLRRFDEAKPYFLEIKGKIGKPQVLFELGLISEKQGNFDDAYNYYIDYINLCYKKHDKRLLNKGLTSLIEYLNNQYKFELALENISLYQSINPEDTVQYDYLMAVYYYRKQDYDKSKTYFKKLYGTDLENKAKNYLTIIYRYTGEKDKANLLLDELSSTEYSSQVTLNSAKQLRDKHTKQSLNEAYNLLLTIQDDDIKTITMFEKIQILIKLGKYDLADSILEKGYEQHSITTFEYHKCKPYILCKQGRSYEIDPNDRNIFINFSIKYDKEMALENVIRMNTANNGRNDLHLTIGELTDLFYELSSNLDKYDYYTSELYDIYIIEMNDIIGNHYGIETKYIEVKCEQNTHNIHMIQPTCKKINVTKYDSRQRKRTELDEN